MSYKNFISNTNKGLIWNILQESGIFNDISQEKQPSINKLFDSIINGVKPDFDKFKNERKNEGFDVDDDDDDDDGKHANFLITMNKYIIKKMMEEINIYKSQINNLSQSVQFPQSVNSQNINPLVPNNKVNRANMFSSPSNVKPKMELIYTAEDIKNERQNEIQMKLKEKENEMNTFLQIKKPQDIDFSDKNNEEEKIGSNMDRLIADALASRERELEQLTNNIDIKTAQEWIGNSEQNKNQPSKIIPQKNIKPTLHENKEDSNTYFNKNNNTNNNDKKSKKVQFNENNEEIYELDSYDLSEYNTYSNDIEYHNNNNSNISTNNSDSTNLSFLSKLKPKITNTNTNNTNTNTNITNTNTNNINNMSEDIDVLRNEINILKAGQEQILTLLNKLLEKSN